ncbi:MAG: 2-dehydropantoate 2-reductase [Lautropia sp.]
MRIAVVGLGAMGGYIAARMLAAGLAPAALVTPRHLAPLAERGLELRAAEGSGRWPIRASARAAELGVQDVLVLALKATALPAIAPTLAPLIGPRTLIVAAMNGVPWWFFHGLDAGLAARPLAAVDPGGVVGAALPPAQTIGCVLHLAASQPAPGVVEHAFGNRFLIGDPLARGAAGSARDRAPPLIALFAGAGMEAAAVDDIQAEVWYKLWGNMTTNPISAMTGATMDRIFADPDVRAFMRRVMVEAGEVSRRFGITVPGTPEERFALGEQLGAFRTSMLQDVDGNRPIELDGLLGTVIEIADRLGVAVPDIRTLMGLTRLRAQTLGLYPAAG